MRSLSVARCIAFVIAIAVSGIFTTNLSAQPRKKIVKKPAVKVAPSKPATPKMVPGTRVLITTDSGNMVVRLYDSTPLHRDNFIAKVNEGFFDSLLFHRVIRGFMLQGGDPNSKHAQPGEMLGMGSAPGDRIPAEFRPTLFHKKGALAAARDNNPEKASSNCQFYIVQGKKMTDQEIEMMAMQTGKPMLPEQKFAYKTLGGTPFLDQNYTVFGEVEIGIGIIDKIASVPTAPGDRPVSDVRMQMKVLTDAEFADLWKQANKKIIKPATQKTIKKKTR
ncbi:MAG: peptidylprolyl isomerase [Chitinophagaceae bacterium]